jgi:hypothetical protein
MTIGTMTSTEFMAMRCASDQLAYPRPPLRGPTGLHRTRFHKRKNPNRKKQSRFSVFLFPTLKSIASTLEASAALAGTVPLNYGRKGYQKAY